MLKNPPLFPLNSDLPKVLEELLGAICRIAHNPETGNRPEDLISAGAAFTGESVMQRAGEFDFDRHDFAPGQPIFSTTTVNAILFDRVEWSEMPANSIFGILYRALIDHRKQPWPRECFPDVRAILSGYAAARRNGVAKADWGKAPLSAPPQHFPSERMPPTARRL